MKDAISKIVQKPSQHKHITKIVQKSVQHPHLIKINHTHGGAGHPIRRPHPIRKDSRFFRRRPVKKRKRK